MTIEEAYFSQLVDGYLELAGQSLEGAFGPDRARWIDRLEQEQANLQQVFEWLIERGDADRGLRLAYLLQELWFEDQHTGEARRLFARLLALPSAVGRTGDRARYLDLAGAFALNQEDYAEARRLKQEGLAICRELGDRVGQGTALIHLGHVERYAGNFQAAKDLYQEALEIFILLDDHAWIAHAAVNMGSIALEQGSYQEAYGWVNDSLQRYQELGFEWEWASAIGTAAGIAAGLGQPERALRLAGASAAHRRRIGVSLPPLFEAKFEQMIASARQFLAGADQKRFWEQGQALSLEQATAYALEDAFPFND